MAHDKELVTCQYCSTPLHAMGHRVNCMHVCTYIRETDINKYCTCYSYQSVRRLAVPRKTSQSEQLNSLLADAIARFHFILETMLWRSYDSLVKTARSRVRLQSCYAQKPVQIHQTYVSASPLFGVRKMCLAHETMFGDVRPERRYRKR